jgi:uncharacterized protein (DUF2267 family)
MQQATLQRITAETSRASEYFTTRELQTMTGQDRENFATVVMKELVDNALDAAEIHGVNPEISITCDIGQEITLTITDNGPGLGTDTIKKILNFNSRVSSNSIYRSPTRGAQGNAWKTVLGIPGALGGTDPVIIESQGIKHIVRAWADPAGIVRVEHDQEQGSITTGCSVTVTIPNDSQLFMPELLARSFAVMNPHCTFMVKIRQSENSSLPGKCDSNTEEIYYPTADTSNGWRKYMPTDPTSPFWYSGADLERLIFSNIAQGRNCGRMLTLREFVRQFRGLSGSAKAKQVTDQFPDIQTLSDFDERPQRIADLLDAMQGATASPSANVLGYIGADHFRACFERHGLEQDRFWYKRISGDLGGIPYVIEAALGQVNDGGLYHGVNFSPTFDEPFTTTRLQGPKFSGWSFRGFLNQAHCDPFPQIGGRGEIVAAFHLVCPALEFLDKGKTRLKVPAAMADDIAAALWAVCKTIYAEEERRKKDAARQERQDMARIAEAKPIEITLKDAVFRVMQDAVDGATGGGTYPTSARHLYYNVRRRIQKYTKRELKDNEYFRPLLNEYQSQHGQIKDLYYAPRGTLYEPHTGQNILVGTKQIASYQFKDWHYDKILYAEKDAVWPILEASGLLEKYDMAVLIGQGYATEAARELFQRADKSKKYKLFVLHDADPHGYNIARTLREETARMPGYSVDVIDIGLTVVDALALEMEEETFSRQKALAGALELSDIEHEYFIGRQVTFGKKPQWIAKRFELDTMTSPQMIAYVEQKLKEHGANTKVIPPDEYITDWMQEQYERQLRDTVMDEIKKRLDVHSLVQKACEKFDAPAFDPSAICEKLQDLPPIRWNDVAQGIVRKSVDKDIRSIKWDEVL